MLAWIFDWKITLSHTCNPKATKNSCIIKLAMIYYIERIWYHRKENEQVSKKDKLLDRLLKKPKDFTFDEMVSLLSYFGYESKQTGTGSGVKFIKKGSNEVISFHKPHPSGVLKQYVLDQVIEKLRRDGLI